MRYAGRLVGNYAPGVTMADSSKEIGAGRVSFLTEEQKRRIYDAALGILGDIGMVVLHEEGEQVMLDGGCVKDADGLVHVPAALVEQARETAPASFPVYDRDGEPAMDLGGYRSYFGNGSDVMHLHDLETGERRLGKMQDVAEAARLCDALPEIDFVMSGAWPDGMDASEAYPRQFRAMIPSTTKPLVMTAGGVETVEPMWRMACAVRGGEAGAPRQAVLHHVQPAGQPPQAPLRDRRQAALLRRQGHPVHVLPLAGGRWHGAHHHPRPDHARASPRLSSAWSCTNSVPPARRSSSARAPTRSTWATSQSSYNSPEFIRAYAMEVEMAKWLDIPNWGFSGHTDAQVVDAQAGMEADEITKLSMQLGANLNHDVGYMDFGLSGSLAQVVLVAEFISRDRQLLKAIEVDDEELAIDVLKAVGPGGDYLGQRHTRKHLRANQWRAKVLNRASYDRWREAGALDATQKAASGPRSCWRRTRRRRCRRVWRRGSTRCRPAV